MLKNRKMSFIVTSAVAIIVALGLLLLYIIASNGLTDAMKESALNVSASYSTHYSLITLPAMI